MKRLTGGTSELYDVLGKLPGVNPEDLIGDTHGGLVETSQLLALHPEWVERDYAELPRQTVETWLTAQGDPPPAIKAGTPASIMTMIKVFRGGLRFFRAETYAGAPGNASAELGERILNTLGEKGAEAVTEILDGTLPPDEWHSPLWKQRFWFTNPVMVRFFNRVLGISNGVA